MDGIWYPSEEADPGGRNRAGMVAERKMAGGYRDWAVTENQ